MNVKEIIEVSKLNIDKQNILYNQEMKKYTSFKIGGKAECLIFVYTKKELKKVLEFVKIHNIKITILGNCSNVLISEKGIKGITLIIKIDENLVYESNLNFSESGEIDLIVGAGVKLSKLGQFLLKNEITGFEELSGIPGTIGGAVKMNAGAHLKEMKDIIEYVKCVDYEGEERIFLNSEMEFGYRTSIFKNNKYIITEVKINLRKGKYSNIKEKMTEYLKYRKEKQPIEYPNAGSTFKRGADYITAKIIDDLGLKGYKIGGAEVSKKHAGFIINSDNATSEDVIELVEYIKKTVYEKTLKKLELEIEIIGEKQEVTK